MKRKELINGIERKRILIALFLITIMFFNNISVFAKTAENFSLEDQFGNKISVEFPSNRPVVLVFGDREGSAEVEGWVRPVYTKFTDKLYIFGIAELSAVPRVAKPVVRRIIKSKSKNPIMLDWSGAVSKSFGCEKGKANVFVVNKKGEVVAVKRGAATAAELTDLYREINALL
jgi:hypothetical protein